MRGGQRMAKQLDCTTSIKSTKNNGICATYLGPPTTCSRLICSASNWKHGSINISGMDWTISRLNYSNQQVPLESSSLNSIPGSLIMFVLRMTHLSSDIIVQGYFQMYSLTSSTSCFSGKPRFLTAAHCWLWGWSNILCDNHRRLVVKISFQREWPLCQSYVNPTRLTWPICQAISMPGRCISQLVKLKKIFPGNLQSSSGLFSGGSHIPRKVPKTLMNYGITWLEFYCLNLCILTSLALAHQENGI